MPAIPSDVLLAAIDLLRRRRDVAAAPDPPSASPSVVPEPGVQIVCAWPVSGQYGAGSRFLYYVLVAACIFARKAVWIRNSCLAAALLVPVVAAIHGIVLAAMHNDNAVDMDIYGAFQLCAIGVLAAPVTVRLSSTYLSHPGRNAIFVWSAVNLAGLISLAIEFYRSQATNCTKDAQGNPITNASNFYNSDDYTCGLICDTDRGPFSPLRGGSANNIYVVPAPYILTFNAATLLCAACCIPVILLLAAMWIKILHANWRAKFGAPSAESKLGNNRFFRRIRENPEAFIFGSAEIVILVVGERNLFSKPVRYMTEPLANIGQWAPIAATGLAVVGSLYLLLAEAMEEERTAQRGRNARAARRRSLAILPDDTETDETKAEDVGILRRVARILIRISERLGVPGRDRFDDTHFEEVREVYPEIPGEGLRNRELSRTRSNYNPPSEYNMSLESHDDQAVDEATLDDGDSPTKDPACPPEEDDLPSSSSMPPIRRRRSTLEVPEPMYHAPTRHSRSDSFGMSLQVRTSTNSQATPAIVVSDERNSEERPP